MKKIYTLALSLLMIGGLSAQKSMKTTTVAKFNENVEMGAPVKFEGKREASKTVSMTATESYFYESNNARVAGEANTFLGKDKTNGGFDTVALYGYTVKQKVSGTTTYRARAYQMIPNTAALKLTSVDFLGKSMKSSGTSLVAVKVLNKAWQTIDSTTASMTTTYGYTTATFANPVSSTDTIFLAIEMTNATDSFSLAKTHTWAAGSVYKVVGTAGTAADTAWFDSALPFIQQGSIFAVNTANNAILGYIQLNLDFYIYPKFTYDVTAAFDASVPSLNINLGDSIYFTSTGNLGHVKNPVLNYVEWDYLANGVTAGYTAYKFNANSTVVYPDLTTSYGIKYSSAGTKEVKAYVFFFPWAASTLQMDSVSFTVNVNGAGIANNSIENVKVFSANNQLTIQNNGNAVIDQVAIYNLMGQEVAVYNVANSNVITLNTEVASANYVVRVRSNKGFGSYKLMIQ